MSRYFNEPKKKGRPSKKSDSSIKENVQEKILAHLQDEYSVAKTNMDKVHKDFDTYYDMIHCIRTNKPNEWESDIFLPEFVSRLLTQIGNFVARYFSSRDIVEADLESDDPQDVAEAKASKKLLNIILNKKSNYYYQKVVRLMMFSMPVGYGIIKGGYRQKVEKTLSHFKTKTEYVKNDAGDYLAEDGMPYIDPYRQKPLMNLTEEPVLKDDIIEDEPIFDVYPTQHVHLSPEYAYSLQDKEYVIFEMEQTLDGLQKDKQNMGYFNLDLLKEDIKESSDELGEETYKKDESKREPKKPVSPKFIVLERWGKYPIVVDEWVNDKPMKYRPGIDKDGEFIEGAENLECIVTFAKKSVKSEDLKKLIRFQVSGHSRRPMAKFLCYVDPIKDTGIGDGEIAKELQIATNDNYNLMNYRTKLATTPAFKSKRFSGIDSNVKISPEKAIEVENMEDLQEFEIKDNIQGSIVHQQLLSSRMDYAMATSPVAMGHESERRETATAASIVNQRMNIRLGMKNMNFEFIGFTEFYDMILTLCNDFMLPETLEKLLGKEAFAYNPKREDRFKPVSQALETEESKTTKSKQWIQIAGIVTKFPNPKTPAVMNYIIGQVLELWGGDFKHFKKFMFSEDVQSNILYQIAIGNAPGPDQPLTITEGGEGPQNEQGLPQSNQEQATRMAAER